MPKNTILVQLRLELLMNLLELSYQNHLTSEDKRILIQKRIGYTKIHLLNL